MLTDPEVQKIVDACCEAFRTFGRGSRADVDNNPIAAALDDRSPTFAAGVDVETVVRFFLTLGAIEHLRVLEEKRC